MGSFTRLTRDRLRIGRDAAKKKGGFFGVKGCMCWLRQPGKAQYLFSEAQVGERCRHGMIISIGDALFATDYIPLTRVYGYNSVNG